MNCLFLVSALCILRSALPLYADWTSLTSGTSSALNSIHFIDSSNGWAVGSNGVILKTTDGGSTWFTQTSGTPTILRDVKFINTSTGCVVSNDGSITAS